MEETPNVTVKSVSIKWGLINGLIGIALTIVIDLMGLTGNQGVQWIGLLIFLGILIMAHREFKSDGDGYMSYGQGLGIGTLTALISSITSSIFTFIYVSYINSGMIEMAREKAIRDMEARGSTDAEIEQGMQFVDMMTSPTAFLVLGIIFGVFFGFLVSLVVSAITQNKRPENQIV